MLDHPGNGEPDALEKESREMKPILHGASVSPFVRKVRVVLAEKGIAYDQTQLIPVPKTPELMALNPLGKVPIYQEGDFTLPDSSAIVAYLERAHPSPSVFPRDAKDFGRAVFLEEYADTKLVETVGPIFFERFVKPNLFRERTDEAVVQQKLTEDLPPVLDWLESQVSGEVGVVGGRFSIADIALCSPLCNLRLGGESVDAKRWPKLARYVDAVTAHPSVASVLADEPRALGASA
jgi:glutathione S-transferase